MKSLKIALAALLIAPPLVLPAAALAHPDPAVSNPAATLLTVTAEGRTTRTPDLAVFSAGVVTQGDNASAALSANAAAMNRVFASLKKNGIADRDIQTSQIGVNPVYGQPVVGPNGVVIQEPRIVGYQATNTVTVRSRDLAGFGRVLDALVASGANQVNGPSFQLAEPAAATDEARTRAMQAARARAELYARAAGLRVARIVSISENGGYAQPRAVYARAAMVEAAPSPVAPGEVEAEVSLTVQFELAP